MTRDPDKVAALRDRIAACWDRAQAHWTQFLLLSEPIDDSEQESVAQIHIGTRQISLNYARILDKDLLDCVEGLLAHEIGHHVRYPASLATQARLRLLEKSLIPLEDYSLINLFTDFLINAHLGPALKDQFVKVYQSFDAAAGWKRDPAFLFYLACYEELWRLPGGTLLGPALLPFEAAFPQYRAEAELLAQNLAPLGPNLYTQFLYFLSVLSRYIKPLEAEHPQSLDPYRCGAGEPTPEDWADALIPTAREREAIKRARDEGWINPAQARRMEDQDRLDRRIRSLPGQGTDDASRVPDVMAAFYRQQAERFLLRPPPQRLVGEAVVPTTLDEWEPGDAVRDIDWLATILQRGDVLGAAQPLRRTRIAEQEGYDVPLWQPRVELYLDVSGSMPDPRTTRNAMTLAALILAMGGIRAGGWARALLYSHAYVDYWQWCRSEVELSRFLMHYVGGGTVFPFGVLRQSARECAATPPVRVIISDRDFDMNYEQRPDHARDFADAIRQSAHLVLLQHRPDPEKVPRYRAAGAKVIPIEQLDDYPKMAGALARALFEDKAHGPDGLVL